MLYKNNEIIDKTVIDAKYSDACKIKKWRLTSSNRVYTGNGHSNEMIQLQQYLYRIEYKDYNKEMVIDHMDSDPLNNRMSNLRLTTQSNNCKNKKIPSNNKTGIVGVYCEKGKDYYVCEIEDKTLGKVRFRKKMEIYEAAYVRYLAEIHIFKGFRSKLNDEIYFKYMNKLTENQKLILDEYFWRTLFKKIKPEVLFSKRNKINPSQKQ